MNILWRDRDHGVFGCTARREPTLAHSPHDFAVPDTRQPWRLDSVRDFAAPLVFAMLLSAASVDGGLAPLASAAEPVVPRPTAGTSAVPADSTRAVYMQRDANGKAVFTDRPSSGLVTERRWAIEPEDAQAAAARREASRAQSERVTERIQRSIDQQQQRINELQIEQLRAQRAADALQAERLRERERDDDNRYVLLRPYARPFGYTPFGQVGPYRPDAQPPRPKPPVKPAVPVGPLAPPVESR
jgi:hypothetical protein